ncbi:hypothetical protein TruAng_007486 [Truncatella angustata]|nr:hypothetical protein TruAng_007486 [Truncatella angustata]
MRDTSSIEPIAIVGQSFRLPGGADDVDGLWRLLESGKTAWTSVPEDRYNGEAFYHPSADDPNGTSNHPGGHFISGDVRDFDHAFFHFSKSQAAAIDPQQRLLLELAYEALESAGMPREAVAGSATSVYTAIFPMDYDRHLYKDTMDLPVYYMTGVEKAMLSNRISHLLDLRGPSMTLDTACSGGLVALHQACQSLQSGESDTALVAASNLLLGPDHFIGLSNLHMLSSSGRCYPFDDRGEGYGRGEGVAVLVLKRLEDAIRDRDPVRAVVRSTAIGQDGYTPQSITYPNGQAQAELARTAYLRAGLRPQEVAYVEAHGTGTKAGDQQELEGIASVFADSAVRQVPLYVGSIKGAIGHTESTAGLASLLKAAVMLERELIPPVAGFENPKPGLPLDQIQVPTKVIPWPRAEGVTPRISINSFGFGGANAHAILERGPRAPVRTYADDAVCPRLFTLSANSPASLKAMIQTQHDWIEHREEVSLADLSYTLLHRRSALPYRFSTVASGHASLMDAFRQGLAVPISKPVRTEMDIVAVFTGQGAQWPGMGRELLLETTPPSVFRSSIRVSRDILHELGATWDLETELLRDTTESRLNEAELAQPATTALQIALIALVRAQGLRISATVGHSSGEIAAAYAAGYLSHAVALKISFHRGFMAMAVKTKGLGPGAMLSVGLDEQDAMKYLEGLSAGEAVVACVNSPRSVTISGDDAAIQEVENRITAADDGTFHRKLLVDTAYHSHHMRAVADDYRARLGTLEIEHGNPAHEIVFISSVTGEPKTSDFGAEYWIANLVSPVRFSDAVQTLGRARHQRHAVFIEIGPHPALSGPVRQSLQHPDVPKFSFDYRATLERKVGAVTSVLALAGQLFESGVNINWDAVSTLAPDAQKAVVRHDLPAYTWDHSTKHWHESRVARAYRLRKEPYHDLLGLPVSDGTDMEPRWRHFLSRATLPWLQDHVVDGLTVFPGAGYVCMAIEGVAQLARQRFPQRLLETVAIRDISFKRGLVIPDSQRVELQLSLRPQTSADLCFRFAITALSDSGEWYEHATGVVEGILAESNSVTSETIAEEIPVLPPGSDTTSAEKLYKDMDAVGNTYGPGFTGLHSISMAADASQASSAFDILDIQAMMPAQHQQPHVIHPSTLDIIFHTALPLAGRRLGPGSIMPVHVGEVLISTTPSLTKPGAPLDVSTLLTSSSFRTAVSDIKVLARGHRVLSISDMEFRSLGGLENNGHDGNALHEICYELDWKVDIEHMRPEDLPSDSTLAHVLAQTTLKRQRFTSIGLGASVDLTGELLNGLGGVDKVAAHEFIDTTPGRFEDAAKRLKGFPVQYRTLRPGTNPTARGFEVGVYDIVITASSKWLSQAAMFVKPGGIVLLVLSARDSKDNTWRAVMTKMSPPLEEQLTLREEVHGKLIVVAKPVRPQISTNVHILTHTTDNRPAWVSELEKGLGDRAPYVSLRALSPGALEALASNGATGDDNNETIIVVDDQPDSPILADPHAFIAARTLLTQPSRIIWLSPDSPLPFHQIEGFARTAHAENDHLRLTTIHAAPGMLTAANNHDRLLDLVTAAAGQVGNPNIQHTEREYRIGENGTVMVPRLLRNDRLNKAIAENSEYGRETKSRRFIDTEKPLVLSGQGLGLFVDDEKHYGAHLGNEEVEVEARAIGLSKAGSAAPLGEYTGVVTSVGADVKSLAPGDRVAALAPVVGANRVRIPHNHAGRLPPNVPSDIASTLMLDLMAATHALRGVGRLLSSGGTVLVHGVRTSAGRAAVAVARSIGARVTATASDATEAGLLREQLGIDAADVLVARRSLHRRLPRDVFAEGLDVVFQTGESSPPAEVLPLVKPFGSVVAVGSSSRAALALKLPPNVSFHQLDVSGLMQSRPDLIGTLFNESMKAFHHIPLSGLEVPIRDVSEVAEALRLVNTGVQPKVVLKADPESTVQIIPATKTDPWSNERATYVVAGGHGDLGRRLLFQLARCGVMHLATISRRTFNQETHDTLQAQLQIVRPGICLYTLQGDISSESSLQAVAASLFHQGAPPVHGVIQSAMVMIDRPLELTTHEDFLNVTKVKVDGTLALHRVFASRDLRFFLSLSSVASIVGAQAEASYSAGNTVQDALAHQRLPESNETRFLTINIGWSEGAVLTQADETRQGALRRAGFSLIPVEELMRFFDYILGTAMSSDASPSQAIIGFDAESLDGATAHNGTIQSALFSQVRDVGRASEVNAAEEGAGATAGSGKTYEQVIAEGDTEAVSDFISYAVTRQLARLISVEVGSIDARQGSILALGLDSLVAVELRNWVTRQFDAPLQSSEILANQTVHSLAEKIATRSKKAVGVSA